MQWFLHEICLFCLQRLCKPTIQTLSEFLIYLHDILNNISSDQGANFATANAQQHTCDHDPVVIGTLHHMKQTTSKTSGIVHGGFSQSIIESLQDVGATLQYVGFLESTALIWCFFPQQLE